jgi:cell division protein FtsN
MNEDNLNITENNEPTSNRGNLRSRDAERIRSVLKRSTSTPQKEVIINSNDNSLIAQNNKIVNQNINLNNPISDSENLNDNSLSSEPKEIIIVKMIEGSTSAKSFEPTEESIKKANTKPENTIKKEMPKKRNPVFTIVVILIGLVTGLALYVLVSEQISKYFPVSNESIDSVGNSNVDNFNDTLNSLDNSSIDIDGNKDTNTVVLPSGDDYKLPYPNNNNNVTENEKKEIGKIEDQKTDIKNNTNLNNSSSNSNNNGNNGSVPDIRGNSEFNSALNGHSWKANKTKIQKEEENLKNAAKTDLKASDKPVLKNKISDSKTNPKNTEKLSPSNERTVSDINEKKVHSKGVIDKSKPNLNTQLKTKYVVQVHSTPDESEAKKVAQQLKAKGIKGISVMPTLVNGKKIFRVRFGSTGTKQEAEKDAGRAGYKKSWIIPSK